MQAPRSPLATASALIWKGRTAWAVSALFVGVGVAWQLIAN